MNIADIKRFVITCGAAEVAYDFDPEKGELQVYLGTYVSEAPKTDTLQRTRILPGFTQWAIEGDLDAWISVEDRLPEEGSQVLVYRPASSNKRCYLVCDYFDKWDGEFPLDFYDNVLGVPIQFIAHWMALPDPPEVNNEPKV